MAKPRGHIAIVLHCHLPYVRHPEHEDFLEEDWFYEAVAETYVPLLLMLRRLEADGVPGKLTVSFSPTLCEMATNELLVRRCRRYLEERLELAEKETRRTKGSAFAETARLYRRRYGEARRVLQELGPDGLPGGFAELARRGRIELIGTAATHALLPLLETRTSRWAQMSEGLANFGKYFDGRPDGFWLPECAYSPGLDELLAQFGFRYCFMDTHGVLLAEPAPPFGVFAPLETPSGILALGRDVESSRQVWSADEGYPGHPVYREFYRDLGFDADLEYLRPYVHSDGERRYLGLKYHRVTGDVPLDQKRPYDPVAARSQAHRHAEQFVRARRSQVARVHRATGIEPLLVAPYDAELFGHWWFEGLWFLEKVLRLAAEADDLVCTRPSAYLAGGVGHEQAGRPALSSWGQGGYFEPWE
ncbi:MAG: DUF1957 domain-containing protein, partial [Candidatus Brocadiia bacterium]